MARKSIEVMDEKPIEHNEAVVVTAGRQEAVLRRCAVLGMVVAVMLSGCRGAVSNAQDGLTGEGNRAVKRIHDFVVKSIDGKDVALAD